MVYVALPSSVTVVPPASRSAARATAADCALQPAAISVNIRLRAPRFMRPARWRKLSIEEDGQVGVAGDGQSLIIRPLKRKARHPSCRNRARVHRILDTSSNRDRL